MTEFETLPEVKKEDAFIRKIRLIIEENIDNYELDVNLLCNKLFISRAQLHKKLSYLTGGSTTKFIKKIRLEKAEQLLKETNMNITEIAHETGFSAQYFSRVFTQTYGCSPKKYRKKLML